MKNVKYLSTITGNHSFDFNGVVITAWVVVGNETICISLDNYKGEWLRKYGNFDSVEQDGAEGMLKFIEANSREIAEWIPKSQAYAELKRGEREAERRAEADKRQAKIDKDRAIPLYRSVRISKGKHKVSIATQPYQSGIYVAISDTKVSGLIQLGYNNHNTTNRNIKKIIELFRTKGYKITEIRQKVEYAKV